MTRDELRAYIERFMQTWEAGDVRALATCYSAHATLDSPMFPHVNGRERIEQSFHNLFRVFNQWKFDVDDVVVDGDEQRVVVLGTSNATHVGEAFGYPGSGRRFKVRTMLMFRFEGGLISAESRLYDFTGLLVQVGVLKAKGV